MFLFAPAYQPETMTGQKEWLRYCKATEIWQVEMRVSFIIYSFAYNQNVASTLKLHCNKCYSLRHVPFFIYFRPLYT